MEKPNFNNDRGAWEDDDGSIYSEPAMQEMFGAKFATGNSDSSIQPEDEGKGPEDGRPTDSFDENAQDSVPKAASANGTENAMSETEPVQDKMASSEKEKPQDPSELPQVQRAPGPVESDPTAWRAFMESLDSQKVGGYTVRELTNVLTNESRDLSSIGPSVALFDNDLDQAKYVQAHAIINNAMLTKPNPMAHPTITSAAAASPGHARDVGIMRQAYFDRMTRGSRPR